MTESKDEVKPLRLSVSAIKTYHQCMRKYFFQYIEKLPRKDWEHTKVGTFVHAVLEKFHNEFILSRAKKLSDDQFHAESKQLIIEICKEAQSAAQPKDKLSSEQAKQARAILAEYIDHLIESGFPDVLVNEKKFNIDMGDGVSVIGYIDRIDRNHKQVGVYHLLDYKTGKSKYLDEMQLQVYAMAFFEENPEVNTVEASYLCLAESCKSMPYKVSRTDVERIKKEILETAKEIRGDKTWDAKPSFLCKYCDFADICESCPDKFKPQQEADLVKIGGDKGGW